MKRILLLALALTSLSATAEVYRWVDSAGKVHFSDSPPPGSAREVMREKDASAVANDQVSFAARRAAENFPVTLFTTSDCPGACKKARELLSARGVPFTEKVLQKAEDAEELKLLVGDTFVPSLRLGKQTIRGFEADSYNNLLDLAGYPAASGTKPPAAAP